MIGNEVHILLVEDDEVDAEAVTRAFLKHKIANPIIRAGDGLEALGILRGEGVAAMPRPYIILLDLNMPRMNGLEFLQELRDDDALTDSVVFVLTTSDDERDKTAAYKTHIAGYVLKSKAREDFSRLIELMDCYWKIVELPCDTSGLAARQAPATFEQV